MALVLVAVVDNTHLAAKQVGAAGLTNILDRLGLMNIAFPTDFHLGSSK